MSKRKIDNETDAAPANTNIVSACFKSDTGEVLPGGQLSLPVDTTVDTLQTICNGLLQQEKPLPLAFYVNNIEVTDVLETHIKKKFEKHENYVEIVYQPQALFKVRAVTRCTGSLEGHWRLCAALHIQ